MSSEKKPWIPKHVSQGCIDSLLVMTMTISPSIIGVLLLLYTEKFKDFTPQFKSGEFLIYSVSFLCAAFLVFSEKSDGKKDYKSNINSLIFLVVLFIAAFYGIILAIAVPNIKLIKIVSIIAFSISIPLFFYSQILNNQRTPDIGAQRTTEANRIADSIS